MASFMNKIKAKMGGHKKDAQSETTTTTTLGSDSGSQQPIVQSEETAEQPQQVQEQPQDSQPQDSQPQGNSGDDPSGSSEDHEGCLSTHNKARSEKSCKPLQWDSSLAADAESYAQTLAEKDKMEHAGVEGQGENLYMSTGEATFDQAVQSWLDEEKDYGGEKIGEGNFGAWGHFSQCLWHSTTHVGMGKAKASSGATYIVARYTPQGNMAGEKPF